MQLYMIRRNSGWPNGEELQKAAARSREVAESEFPQDIRWIRSYVVSEEDGSLGTFCVYEASSEDAVRSHAEKVGMPADVLTPIVDTVVIRPDPEPAAASG